MLWAVPEGTCPGEPCGGLGAPADFHLRRREQKGTSTTESAPSSSTAAFPSLLHSELNRLIFSTPLLIAGLWL